MTHQEIDQHIENGQEAIQSDPTSDNFDICAMYHAVRPVLVFVTQSGLLKLFKPKWVAAIQKFIDAQDIKCPL